MFGLAALLLERALEDGSLSPAALAPASPAPAPVSVWSTSPTVASSAAAATGSTQLAKPAQQQAAAVGKYDGLRLMLRQATVEQVGPPGCATCALCPLCLAACPSCCAVGTLNRVSCGTHQSATETHACCRPSPPQDWGEPKFDPFPALAGWAGAPTLTRWQQYALAGEYDRYDPVAQLLQAVKQASSRPASHSKYCPVSSLLSLLRGERQGGAAAAVTAAPAPVADAVASSGEGEPADQHSRLLAALRRAAAQPGMQVGWPGGREGGRESQPVGQQSSLFTMKS